MVLKEYYEVVHMQVLDVDVDSRHNQSRQPTDILVKLLGVTLRSDVIICQRKHVSSI